MTRAVDVVLPALRGLGLVSTHEWDHLCTRKHNVLFEGPEDSIEGLLILLEPHLRAPVLRKPARASLELPTGECGALVLQDVSALSRKEQAELLRWLDDSNARTQVVSTAVDPLFPLVARGLFDEALYYRLNVILLCVDTRVGTA